MTSLSALHTVGDQIGEAVELHGAQPGSPLGGEAGRKLSRAEIDALTVDMLRMVGFPDPKRALRTYPFELSGGLRQRAMIAMALVCRPALLIADEPTTALDVTIQAQIMELLSECKAERGMATLLITHDLGLVAQHAERVAIMYAGRIMETATVADLFADPRHPYTRGLLDCVPKLGEKRRRLVPIEGTVPAPGTVADGCPFLERCPEAFAPCRGEQPPLVEVGPGHWVRCWRRS
jgi:oligopeptide/dipeptide ABC transporter ATP-binding protein